MFIIEIKKTGVVLGVELFAINQVFISKQGKRGEVRRLAATVTMKAAQKVARTIKRNLYNGKAAA